MRKIALLLVAFTMATAAMAQSPFKVESALQEQDIESAKNEVDALVEKELAKLQKKGKPLVPKSKTLYLKGQVYQAIATSEDSAVMALAENPIAEALAAYNMLREEYPKASETEAVFEGSVDPANIAAGIQPPVLDQFYFMMINKSGEAYNSGDLDNAIVFIEKAREINSVDTLSYVYGSQFTAAKKGEIAQELAVTYEDEEPEKYQKLMAESKKYADKTIEQVDVLIEQDFVKDYFYQWKLMYALEEADRDYRKIEESMMQLRQEARENKMKAAEKYKDNPAKKDEADKKIDEELDKALETQQEKVFAIYAKPLAIIKEYKTIFPDDTYPALMETNIYLRSGKAKEAITAIEAALKGDPKNKQLLFNLGVMYDELTTKEAQETEVDFDQLKKYRNQAADAYDRALAIDEEYFNAYLNMAALYFNSSRAYNSQLSDLQTARGYSDPERAEELIGEMKELYEKAKPYFEKAIKYQPADNETDLEAFINQIDFFLKNN